jgi:polysaccharide deacetylase family protein (PEP-CTERM system associated)
MITHAFTVDVEEYFQVHALESCIDRSAWSGLESRLAVGLDRLLDLLARHGATGTFFTLGWVAHRSPQLVRRIAEAGHEVASHGYWHRRVDAESAASFAADVRDARDALEQATGHPVIGYRAPSFSIIRASEWALEILTETGHRYDSSRFPIHRRGYGSPHVPLDAHLVQTAAGPLLEVPLTVWDVAGVRIPAAGGGWFRQLPAQITHAAFAAAGRAGRPGVFYIHPWELDPDQPVQPTGLLTRVRHYRGLAQTAPRLDALLRRFRFGAIREAHADQLAHQAMGSSR